MKRTVIMLLVIFCSMAVKAQTYQNDYMTHHHTNNGNLVNRALYKDAVNNIYYVSQQMPADHNTIVISTMDADFNIINTYKYICGWNSADGGLYINNNMYITPYDISIFGNQIIVVGDYIEEGVDRGGFMMSADLTTGAFMWFQKYTGVYGLRAVVSNDDLYGSICVGERYDGNFMFPNLTGAVGVIMRMDNNGAVVWQKDVEDFKYLGHPDNIMGSQTLLLDVIEYGDGLYAAVGRAGAILIGTNPYNDGDGTLLLFDENGSFTSSFALGNATWVQWGGSQILQYQMLWSVTTCSDGDIVAAGSIVESPYTYFEMSCPGITPQMAGIWVTKMNPVTGIVAWSKVFDWWPTPYDPNSFPQPHNIRVANDGTDNYGVIYHSNIAAFLKVDNMGNLVYSRHYTHPSGGYSFIDISTGFGNTDIIGTGYLTAGDAWNVAAFDNILQDCNSAELPLQEWNHPYDVFDVMVADHPTPPKGVLFLDITEQITNITDCEKIEQEDDGGKNSTKPETTISQDAVTNDVYVRIQNDDLYTGNLINAMGQTVAEYQHISKQKTIGVNHLAKGIYYLHLNSNTEHIARMVLVK